jgi:hypothetical protein
MPEETRFCGTATMARDESYMSVLAHELGHYADIGIMVIGPARRPASTANSANASAMPPTLPKKSPLS